MNNTRSTIRYLLIGLLVLILGALSGWFFYLRSATSSTDALGQNRGYGISTPLFGSPQGSTQTNIEQTIGQSGTSQAGNSSSPLWEIDPTPVAGFGFEATSSGSALYYAERGSGNVFEADLGSRSITRLTDTLMAKTYQAYFAPRGGVLERTVSANGLVTTFQAQISTSTVDASSTTSTPSTSTPEELVGANIVSGITQIAVDPTNGALAYLVLNGNAGINLMEQPWGITAKNKAQQIFTSVVGSWQLSMFKGGRAVIAEDPVDGSEGFAYSVASNGALTQLASGPGLTISVDPGSTAIMYGTSINGVLMLYSQSSPKAAPVPLELATVADKCAWLPGASMIAYCAVPQQLTSQTFLNDWYRGLIHTSDIWYQIDAATGSTTAISAPTIDRGFDVQDPAMDPSGTHVIFRNGIDNSLWALNVTQ